MSESTPEELAEKVAAAAAAAVAAYLAEEVKDAEEVIDTTWNIVDISEGGGAGSGGPIDD